MQAVSLSGSHSSVVLVSFDGTLPGEMVFYVTEQILTFHIFRKKKFKSEKMPKISLPLPPPFCLQ